MKPAFEHIEIDPQRLIALSEIDSPQEISLEDWRTVQSTLRTTVALWEAYHGMDRAYQKLSRLIFGPRSEKAKDLFKEEDTGESANREEDNHQAAGRGEDPEASRPGTKKHKERRGSGRAGVDEYPGLERLFVAHPDMKAGDPCTLCPKGCVNRYKGSPILRFKGQPPVGGVIYELERLRCNACGAIFTAPLPAEAGAEKYDATVGSMLAIRGEIKIALFFTGRNHAGENLAKVLEDRHPGRAPPVQVSDALSRNVPKGHATIRGSCTDHARRGFAEASSRFPEQCLYVIEALGQIYKNDETAKNQKMDPWERLRFHCRYSAPVMFELKLWLLEQFAEKKVEPNSALGHAISYMLNHWTRLTLFLWWPGVPLSSCLVEQAIKVLVLARKNFLFYRTEHGAFFGDMFLSIIHTCNLNGVNPFDYITALQRHSSDVFKNPARWMPWNYKDRITTMQRENTMDATP